MFLVEKKKAFKIQQVQVVGTYPRFSEFSAQKLYEHVKTNVNVVRYLPFYSKKRKPSKSFLFDIVNTVYPNSIRNVLDIQTIARSERLRTKRKNTILVTQEFQNIVTEDIFGIGAKGKYVALLKEQAKEEYKERHVEVIELTEAAKNILKFQ